MARDPRLAPAPHGSGRGVAVSLTASVLFAVIFYLAGVLPEWGAEEIFGWRVVLTLVTLACILPFLSGARTELRELLGRVRRRPSLLALGVLAAGLVGVQLWLFMWAPLNGMALSVSFGYFLLPLTMVLAGRFFFADKLSPLRKLAVAAAVAGVVNEAFTARGLAWPTLVVCLGYPIYFVLRRKIGFDNLAAFACELLVLLPFGAAFIVLGPHGVGAGGASAAWSHVWAGAWSDGLVAVMAIGVLGGVAMALYLLASKWLPLSLFGLLGYMEPVLLVAVSLLLGEVLGWRALLTYGPILLALVFLALDGRRWSRRR